MEKEIHRYYLVNLYQFWGLWQPTIITVKNNYLIIISVSLPTQLIINQSFSSFLYPLPSWGAVRSYWTHLEGKTPFEAMTSRTGFIGGLLSRKVNARRSVHSPRYHLIITLSFADRRDSRGKWPLARNQDRSWETVTLVLLPCEFISILTPLTAHNHNG